MWSSIDIILAIGFMFAWATGSALAGGALLTAYALLISLKMARRP